MKSLLTKNKIIAAAIFAAACIMSACLSVFGVWDSLFLAVGLKNDIDDGSFVRFIDVGQGDCTLVQSGGKLMLIDTGDENHASSVFRYIKSLGFEKIDTVVVTHPHADHIGGLDMLTENMTVDRVYITDDIPDGEEDKSAYMNFTDQFGGEILPVEDMGSFAFGEFNLSLVLCDSMAADENDRSAVILIKKGETSFLITGDISASDSKIDLSADVLKIAHHGSKSGTSAEMLSRVNPKYAVISVGSSNTFGHPTAEVLTRLKNAGIKLYRTDCNGTVTFDLTDGLEIDTEY